MCCVGWKSPLGSQGAEGPCWWSLGAPCHQDSFPPLGDVGKSAAAGLGMAKGSLSSLNIQLYTLGFVMGRVGISTQLTPVCFSAACDCNGRSQECYFDPELYRSTGHGGHCMGCRDNTDGAHCERCRDSFYRLGSEEGCLPCSCNPVGKCKGSAADGEPGSGKAFLPFLITAPIGDVYSVVLWLKLSLDLTGLGVAGADSSPLQHLLL